PVATKAGWATDRRHAAITRRPKSGREEGEKSMRVRGRRLPPGCLAVSREGCASLAAGGRLPVGGRAGCVCVRDGHPGACRVGADNAARVTDYTRHLT